MSIFALLALAASSPSAGSYPASDILTEFGRVCIDDARHKPGRIGPMDETVEGWNSAAKSNGWIAVSNVQAGEAGKAGWRDNLDYIAFHRFSALNASLFLEILSQGTERVSTPVFFKKTVGGRNVYISTFAMSGGSREMAECRLYDPLGDGVIRSPITVKDVERWVGRTVKKSKGSARSDQFNWNPQVGKNSFLRVHFGCEGRPFGHCSTTSNPYPSYGMTLATGYDEQEIII